MVIPAVADARVGSPDWTAFILSAFVTAGVGGALVLASGGGMPASLNALSLALSQFATSRRHSLPCGMTRVRETNAWIWPGNSR